MIGYSWCYVNNEFVTQVLFADGTVSQFVQNSAILPTVEGYNVQERPSSGKSPERETPSPSKKGENATGSNIEIL